MRSCPTLGIAEMLSPGFEMVVGKTRWNVTFTHRVLLALEKITGKGILSGELSPWTMNSGDLRSMLTVTAEAQGILGLDLRALGPRILPRIVQTLQMAWEWAMPAPEGPSSPSRGTEPGDWVEAWANAHECLRLSGDEWLDSTPRMIQTLGKYRLESLRQGEWMTAQLTSTVANFSMCHPRDPVKAEVYMLHPWENLPSPSQPGSSLDQILGGFRDARWVDPASRQVIADILAERQVN